jgi:hypothetical protein
MILPVILGQAPSRLGDGRPFTGPSGDRLLLWAQLETRDELLKYFRLDNLLSTPLPQYTDIRSPGGKLRTPSIGRRVAKDSAQQFTARQYDYLKNQLGGQRGMDDFIRAGNAVEVICLGRKVWEAFGLPNNTLYLKSYLRSQMGLKFYRFPHPSGLNHLMNDLEFLRETSEALRRVGCIIDRPTYPEL